MNFWHNRNQADFLIIFLLGISSALPLSIISSTLKVLLIEKGFGLEFIGSISLLTIPYSLKFLLAPLIDSYRLPFLFLRLGRRKSWIILSQILLVVFIFALGDATNFNSKSAIIFLGLMVAIASSCQDVVVDGYRIELFSQKNQALAAGFYVYGYRLGLLISGAFALFLADILPWKLVYMLISLFMLICAFFTLFAREAHRNSQFLQPISDSRLWNNDQSNFEHIILSKKSFKARFKTWLINFVIRPFALFARKKNWLIILAFIAFFKLSDSFAGNLTAAFLREIGFSKTELAIILKTFGLAASLIGVLFGGILARKFGLSTSLWVALLLQGASNVFFSLQAYYGHVSELLYSVILIENLSGGIGDAIFIAYLSSLCSKKFSATQYALLSSLASVSRSFLCASAGSYAVMFGWINFFIFTAALTILPLILLLILSSKSFFKPTRKTGNQA